MRALQKTAAANQALRAVRFPTSPESFESTVRFSRCKSDCVSSMRDRETLGTETRAFPSKDGKIPVTFLRKATVPQGVSLEAGIDVLISSSSCKSTARLFPDSTEAKRLPVDTTSFGKLTGCLKNFLQVIPKPPESDQRQEPVLEPQKSRFQEPGVVFIRAGTIPELAPPLSPCSRKEPPVSSLPSPGAPGNTRTGTWQ